MDSGKSNSGKMIDSNDDLKSVVKSCVKDALSEFFNKEKQKEAGESDCKKLEQEVRRLEQENKKLLHNCSDAEVEKKSLLSKNSDLSAELKCVKLQYEDLKRVVSKNEIRVKECESELHFFTENFNVVKSLYDKYLSLPADVIKSLSGCVCTDSLMTFVVSMTQWKNLTLVWEFARKQNGNKQIISVMRELIEYFFDLYCVSGKNTTYRLLIPKEGTAFDSDCHVCPEGAPSSINQIILPGYAVGNEIKIKPIVK